MESTIDLLKLAGMKTNLVVDAGKITTLDLIQIAGMIGLKGGHLKITNCHKKTTEDLMQIITVYPQNITLDFSS